MEIGPNDFGMQVNVKMLYQWILIHMSKLGGWHVVRRIIVLSHIYVIEVYKVPKYQFHVWDGG